MIFYGTPPDKQYKTGVPRQTSHPLFCIAYQGAGCEKISVCVVVIHSRIQGSVDESVSSGKFYSYPDSILHFRNNYFIYDSGRRKR